MIWKYKLSKDGAENNKHMMITHHGWYGVFDLIMEDINQDYYKHHIDENNITDADLLVTWEEDLFLWIVSYADPKGMYCVSNQFLYLAMAEMAGILNDQE